MGGVRRNRNRRKSPVRLEPMEARVLLTASFANGTENDIVRDSTGAYHLAYFDTVANTMMYAAKPNGGTWSTPVRVDTTANVVVGRMLSINVDLDDHPGIAYYDETNGDLKFAKNNGNGWVVEQAQTHLTSGLYPSLVFNASRKPIISYYKGGGATALYVTIKDGTWSPTLIDDDGDAGRYSSIAIQPGTGRWGISYENTTDHHFWYANQTTSGLAKRVADAATTGGGGFTSLAFNPQTNYPAFSYYDSGNTDLKFAQASSLDGGGTWQTQSFGGGKRGLYTNLWFVNDTQRDDHGTARIVYHWSRDASVNLLTQKTDGTWADTMLVQGADGEEEAVANPNTNDLSAYTWVSGSTLYVNDETDFGAGDDWTLNTGTAWDSARAAHAAVVHDAGNGPRMWVAGGDWGATNLRNDVYSSLDGTTWSRVRGDGDSNGFSRRAGHEMVSFAGKLWVLGGAASNGSKLSDVWSSTDGATWSNVVQDSDPAKQMGVRYAFGAVTFNGYMYVIGGGEGTGDGDVRRSTDGVTWETVQTGSFLNRHGAVVLVYGGAIWIIGGVDATGGGKQDVYKSDGNGANFTLVSSSAPSSQDASGTAYSGKMWLFVGDKAYSAVDGHWWQVAATDPDADPLDDRLYAAALTFTPAGGVERMYIMGGGVGSTFYNDVWSST